MTSFASSTEYRRTVALVLGASGFIGRRVARALAERGARVVQAVRDRARWGLAGDVIETDLMRPGNARALVHAVRPTITFNLAGYGVDREERNERAAFRLNAELVAELAAAITEFRHSGWPGADLVHAGSALEYGTATGDLAEDTVPQPTTVYGKSKLEGTRILALAAAGGNLKAITARLFTVYGPGEHAGRLLPTLIEAAHSGVTVELTAGLQKRDFTYVEDVAEGLCRLGAARTAGGEVVNLATGRLTSVREFAEAAAAVLKIPRERLGFGAIPTRPEEMEHSAPNVDRLRRLVGWTPAVGIEDGIRKTLQFSERGLAAAAQKGER
jgi:nucleoside-diphosphate-sugar epimerase